jgi:type IV secretory pathway VirJ component
LILQQARAGIFSEGISLAPPPAFLLPVSPCGVAGRSVDWRAPDQPIQTPKPVSTPTAWHVVPDEQGALLALQQVRSSTDRVATQTVDNLPLVELPVKSDRSAPILAVFLSGDGGWANIDKDIGEALVDQGIPAVGWNSLKYFWQRKTPEVMARDLDSVITHYRNLWQKQQVLLIGFSLGADVLPFMVNRLSPENRQWVAGMVLLSPSKSADFQFQVTDWVDNSTGETDTPLAPEMDRLLSLPVLCVYGVEDDDGLCPYLQGRPMTQVVRLPGDHHFDGDYETVTHLILQQFVQTAGKP